MKTHKQNIPSQISTDLVKELTLTEKATLVNGATFFGMSGIERLGIPELMLLDGGTGINFEQLFGDFCSKEDIASNSTNGMLGSGSLTRVIDNFYHPDKLSSEDMALYEWVKERLRKIVGGDYSPGCFPSGIMLGATFEPDVIYNMGVALGKEAKLFGIHILLGTPNINIHRDPLGGRLFEGYSEDPHLVSALAPQLVKGVQSVGVAANVKHFAANNQETNRVGINETISERALREIYLPGFKACVVDGGVKTVMSAYNAINGIPCSENKWLLSELLRDEWGFDGVVVSDWGAVYHPVEAISAGNDLAMPGPISGQPLIDAVKSGELSEDILDTATLRLLDLIQYCINGAATPVKESFTELHKETTKAAYEAAAAGIVMLKNSDNVYPLDDSGEPVLILGSGAEFITPCGTGSAGITTDRTSNLADTLRNQLIHSEVLADCQSATFDQHKPYLAQHPKTRVIFIATIGGMEGNDRTDMYLSAEDRKLLGELCSLKAQLTFTLTLVLNVSGPVDISDYEAQLDSIFVCFLPGMEGARALGDIMTGKRYPSGKLPLSFPKHYADTPTFLNFPGEGDQVNYGEGIYVGYRYYDKKNVRPAYPFGFGLGYTSFRLYDLNLSRDTFESELSGSVMIENTGTRDGAEVVQLYISDHVSTLPKPIKELKFFQKVHLKAGEKKQISFSLSEKDFASYDPQYHTWLAEEGYYDIIIATSSAPEDIAQHKRVYLKNHNQYSYGLHTIVKVMYENNDLFPILRKLWDAENWDWQIVESNYQYTPNRHLRDIFPSEPSSDNLQRFLTDISVVLHQ